jgi:aryl-alcohol dehydrogenase-like predicted oxidoreductase
MKYVLLSETGLSVSRICFGCWGIVSDQHWGERDRVAALAAIRAALDSGINFFDTAAMYGNGESERLLAEGLRGRRGEVVIASKLPGNRMHPAEVPQACEQSLQNLGTDYLDLMQTHWTSREVPLSDTWQALLKLQEQGKIRYAGVCNAGLEDLRAVASPHPPVTNQLPYNLLWRMIESEILPCCLAQGIGVLAYSPLMHGLLAGKYRSGDEVPAGRARSRHFASHRPLVRHGESGCEPETFAVLDRLGGLCEELGRPMPEVALAWCLQQPGVACVIAGTASEQQVRSNLAAAEQPLPEEIVGQLNEITQPLVEKLGPNPDLWQGSAESRFR